MATYCTTGLHVPDDDSDAALAPSSRRTTIPLYHPAHVRDGSVVDEQLRVIGLQGLRVVDALGHAARPARNTNAPTI